MKLKLARVRLKTLLKQRNLLFFWCALFGVIGVLQGIVLLMKDTRVVLVPPELKQQVWVEKERVSSSYLEEMGLFFLHLALDMSPGNTAYQREVLLRYALPDQYSQLKTQLLEDERRLCKENLSTMFRPSSVTCDPIHGLVDITGDFMGFVGQKRIFQVREVYRVRIKTLKGRCFLASMQCIRSEGREGVCGLEVGVNP